MNIEEILSQQELEIYRAPVSALTPELRAIAFSISDKIESHVRKLNAEFVPKPHRAYVVSDYSGYECPVTGKWIEGRAAHRENLKQTGCRLLEKGEAEQSHRRRQENLEESSAKSARQIAEKIAQNWGC